MNWKVGDTVCLKSGGPRMTVEKAGNDMGNKPAVWCVWFNKNGEEKRGTYPPEALEKDDGPSIA